LDAAFAFIVLRSAVIRPFSALRAAAHRSSVDALSSISLSHSSRAACQAKVPKS
jgi:hypothetical protein